LPGPATSDPAAFWRSAREGDLTAVLLALDRGSDVNAALVLPGEPDTGGTALHYAASQNHQDLASALLRRGADPNARALDRHAATPLHWAASRGHAGMVTLLLAAGARHDLPDKNGWLPLDLTRLPSVGGRERGRITRLSLEQAGARASARPNVIPWADPDLWAAILEDNLQASRIAIDTGADPNATEPVSGASPLLLATIHGRGEIASFLASRGASLDAPAADGAPPHRRRLPRPGRPGPTAAPPRCRPGAPRQGWQDRPRPGRRPLDTRHRDPVPASHASHRC
ncbi:MAG: ankyrin repeat domain-containing protein, partial [Gemmataceae bacterium]|nr:ankyrin repeat domain-containing protein [Gemmataceae bacterium]